MSREELWGIVDHHFPLYWLLWYHLPDLYGLEHKIKVRKSSQRLKCLRPIQICPYSVCKGDFMVDKLVSCWIWRILRSWPIFIFHIHMNHWNWGGGQREDIADEECLWWVVFPLFCSVISANAVIKEWAVHPWSPDGEEDKERKPPHTLFVSFHVTSKIQLCTLCQRPPSVETILATVYCLQAGERKRNKMRWQIKMEGSERHEMETNKILPIIPYCVMSLANHWKFHLPDQSAMNKMWVGLPFKCCF